MKPAYSPRKTSVPSRRKPKSVTGSKATLKINRTVRKNPFPMKKIHPAEKKDQAANQQQTASVFIKAHLLPVPDDLLIGMKIKTTDLILVNRIEMKSEAADRNLTDRIETKTKAADRNLTDQIEKKDKTAGQNSENRIEMKGKVADQNSVSRIEKKGKVADQNSVNQIETKSEAADQKPEIRIRILSV